MNGDRVKGNTFHPIDTCTMGFCSLSQRFLHYTWCLNWLYQRNKQTNKQTDNKNVNVVRDAFEAWKVLGQNACVIFLPELSKVCPQLHDVPAESRLNIRISGSERVYQRWNFRERCSKYKANVITVKCTCQLGKFGKIRTMLKHVEINRLFSLEKKE